MSVFIDRYSPAGSYRAASNPNGCCAVCRQTECDHPDLLYNGNVPPRASQMVSPVPHASGVADG